MKETTQAQLKRVPPSGDDKAEKEILHVRQRPRQGIPTRCPGRLPLAIGFRNLLAHPLALVKARWRGPRPIGKALLSFCSLIPFASTLPCAFSQQEVEITTEHVRSGIYMVQGRGGNIGVCTGEDTTFIVDDQFAPLTERLSQAISTFSSHPVQFVLNTHWHGDHTGGNENFGKMGALIVAHDNVRERMSAEQVAEAFKNKATLSPSKALPVVTFSTSVTFHLNGEEIHAYHVDPAHTDGDSVIHFRKANVFHLGDLFFNGTYPFIDLSSGGSLTGMSAAVDGVLDLVDENSRIIPGHGPLATRRELLEYRDMLRRVETRLHRLIQDGKSLEEVLESDPTADLDERWGQGFMKSKDFLTIAYKSLAQ